MLAPQRVAWSLTPVRNDRVDSGVVAVREGGGKGWHEAEGEHGAGIGGNNFVHTTVHLEREGQGDELTILR